MINLKILCIGHAAFDITYAVEEFPLENTKNRIKEMYACGGGPANNAAYLLGMWGSKVSFAGSVGNDLYGKKIKEELDQVGVDTRDLMLKQSGSTTLSFIMANIVTGTRTILTHRSSELGLREISCKNPDIILVDGQEYDISKKYFEDYPNAIKIIDAGRANKEVVNLCHLVDYLICSKTFAEEVTNKKFNKPGYENAPEILRELQNKFKTNVVVTLESDGCLYSINNTIKILPSLKMKAVDSTGAGDIFHGAFTYAISNNYSFEEALKIGTIAGGISVTRISGKNSMPTKEEIRKYYNDFI